MPKQPQKPTIKPKSTNNAQSVKDPAEAVLTVGELREVLLKLGDIADDMPVLMSAGRHVYPVLSCSFGPVSEEELWIANTVRDEKVSPGLAMIVSSAPSPAREME